jgi:ribosomal protein S21
MNSKTTIEVKKASNESNMTLVRRFSRRVQESGIVRTVKAQRYNERAPSKLDRKTSALNRLKRGKEVERLKKLGKWVEKTKGGPRR